MKQNIFLSIAFFSLLLSCSPNDSNVVTDKKKDKNTDNELETATALSITPSKNSVNTGDLIEFTSKVTFKNGKTKDKTQFTEFFVNNTKIVGNKYISTKPETIKVKATYSSKKNKIKSKDILIEVKKVTPPKAFTKKVVVEYYTGSWCGICPRVTYALELVKKRTKKVFSVGIHHKDNMANKFSNRLVKINNVRGFPSAYINRNYVWHSPQEESPNRVVNEATGTADVGLSVGSVLSNKNMQITVGASSTKNEELKLVVFILEDKVMSKQVNYTPFYGGEGKINFANNNVLRYSLTDVEGNKIILSKNTVKYKSYNINLSDGILVSNTKNLAVLAILTNKSTGVISNAQYAKVNIAKNFD